MTLRPSTRAHLGALGMIDTGSRCARKVQRFAALYARADGRIQLYDDPQDSAYIRPCTYFSGGGGLVSTASDYLRFCECFGGRGARRCAHHGRKTLDLHDDEPPSRGRRSRELALERTARRGRRRGLRPRIRHHARSGARAGLGFAAANITGRMASTPFGSIRKRARRHLHDAALPSTTFNFRGSSLPHLSGPHRSKGPV